MAKALKLALALAVLPACGATQAHEAVQSPTAMGGMVMDAGRVSMRNSCAPAAQGGVDQGVAALYSFAFAQARDGFAQALRAQPDCAIAHWGVAMSDYEQIEGPGLPEGAQLKDGRDALARAQAATATSSRERAYVEALGIIFDPSVEHDTRVRRYAEAMGKIAEAYPDDPQARVIYAMSLLKDGMPDDPDLVLARKALTLLNGVLKIQPDNSGVIHFIIHAADNPRMAAYGLDAARRYAAVAPAAPHALHMPGHIFARLGLWQEDIRSNLASKAASEQPALIHTEAQNRLHAMEFLQYAYLQTGREDRALAIAREAATVRQEDFSPGVRRYYAGMQAGFQTRQALETRDWAGALALAGAQDGASERPVAWAHAVGAGHLKDRRAAEQALADYRATYDAGQLKRAEANPSSAYAEVKAWVRFTAGDTDGAVALLQPVADMQDKLGKGEVELPAREMIGDMLALAERPAQALAQYEASLEADPGRLDTLLHAAQAARALGRKAQATRYRAELRRNCPDPAPASLAALAKG